VMKIRFMAALRPVVVSPGQSTEAGGARRAGLYPEEGVATLNP
jgi:hypothetical protein